MMEKDLISRAISSEMPDLEQIREKCLSHSPSRKTSGVKYVTAAAVCLIAVLGMSAAFFNMKSKEDSLTSEDNEVVPSLSDTDSNFLTGIVINDLEEIGMNRLDADVKKFDASVKDGQPDSWDFDFLNRIKVPEQLTEVSYREIYTRPISSTNEEYLQSDYTILHDYEVGYSDSTVEKQLRISFSKNFEPLRDYYFGNEVEYSIIDRTTLKICCYKDSYMATFSYEGLNFDIESSGITEQEFIDVLLSIIIK